MRPPSPRRGFTLIELLVVVAIIGVLIALLLPAIQKVRAAALRVKCGNHLKQLALAAHAYETAHGTLPSQNRNPTGARNQYGSIGGPWTVILLPYLEQGPVFDKFLADEQNGPTGGWAIATVIPFYLCPADDLPSPATHTYDWSGGRVFGLLSYGANVGTRGNMDSRVRDGVIVATDTRTHGIRVSDVIDGVSQTIMLGETASGDKQWEAFHSHPKDDLNVYIYGRYWASTNSVVGAMARVNYRLADDFGPSGPYPPNPYGGGGSDALFNFHFHKRRSAIGSFHPGGANVALADGAVRFLPDALGLDALIALTGRADGLVIPEDY